MTPAFMRVSHAVIASRARLSGLKLRRAAQAAVLCATGALGLPARGQAQATPSSLRVEVISCVLEESAVDVSEMLAIARAELSPRTLDRREEDADGQPLLRVDACHDEYLLLRLLRPEGPERRIALHDVPVEQRPRVAALALAELVIAARAQPTSEREPAAKPTPQPQKPPPEPAARAERQFPDWAPEPEARQQPSSRVGFGLEARLFTDSLGYGFGPRIDVWLPHFELSLVSVMTPQAGTDGQYRTGLVAFSPSVALWRSKTRLEVSFLVGGEVGVSWGRAKPFDSAYGATRRRYAPYASGLAQFVLNGRISARAYGRLALSGGYAFSGVRARIEPDKLATTFGPFVAVSVGFAWGLR